MAEDLHELESWLEGLLLQVSPAQLRMVNRRVAVDIRREQSRRISRQINPDGTPYVARTAKNLRQKKGKIKRKSMFVKLRTIKHLRTRTNDKEIRVGFTGRSAVIALVHHYGLTQTQRGKTYRMPKRELLGLSGADIEFLSESYLKHLAAFD